MARTHAIPAITGIENATSILKNDDNVAIDGTLGEIYVNPTEEEKQKLLTLQKQLEEEKLELEKYKNEETKTIDGTKVKLYANIGILKDVEVAIKNTAEELVYLEVNFYIWIAIQCQQRKVSLKYIKM